VAEAEVGALLGRGSAGGGAVGADPVQAPKRIETMIVPAAIGWRETDGEVRILIVLLCVCKRGGSRFEPPESIR